LLTCLWSSISQLLVHNSSPPSSQYFLLLLWKDFIPSILIRWVYHEYILAGRLVNNQKAFFRLLGMICTVALGVASEDTGRASRAVAWVIGLFQYSYALKLQRTHSISTNPVRDKTSRSDERKPTSGQQSSAVWTAFVPA
jgi:hypothetical protein